jgi:predicted esterase
MLGLAELVAPPRIAWLAPQAAGHTWYPYSFLAPIPQNEPWLTSALDKLARTVQQVEQAGIAREKLVIAGFSQGACLASEFVARHAARYGGLIGFSGGLIGPPGTKFRYEGNLAGTPIFLGGVDPDPHVPWQRVEESVAALSALGGEVASKRYPGLPHGINQDEIDAARTLLRGVFG